MMEQHDSSEKNKETLRRYLEGQSSPEETRRILEWYFSFKEEDALPLPEGKQQQVLDELHDRVLNILDDKRRKPYVFFYRMSKVAALLLFGCFLLWQGIVYYRGHRATEYDHLMQAGVGEQKSLRLSDGSRVWLNAASKISYPETFITQKREVKLEGEAFFEIADRADQPFIVHVNGLNIQVLGTSFNVKAHSVDADRSVTVVSGSVAISNGKAERLVLKKGEELVYNAAKHHFSKSSVDPENCQLWRSNTFYFHYQPVREILKALGRWYGVKFMVQDTSWLERKYTLELRNESLEEILRILCAGEAVYSIQEGTVEIHTTH